MHPYSTDESRVSIYGGLAVVAVVLAWIIVAGTSRFSWPQWLVSAPSLAATFAATYAVFDRVLWKLPLLRRLAIVGVVDIRGTYDGRLVSTFKDSTGAPIERDVSLRVAQTWTHICVEMTVVSGTSSSVSTSALGSVTRDGQATRLSYIYRNRVNPGLADADMGDHDGAADLRIELDGAMSGRYFNSRPRAGSIQATRR